MSTKLKSEENKTIAAAQRGCAEATNRLLVKYNRFLWKCVRQKKPVCDADADDFFQEAALAFLACIRNFDPRQKTTFITYIHWCVPNRLKQVKHFHQRIIRAPYKPTDPEAAAATRFVGNGDVVLLHAPCRGASRSYLDRLMTEEQAEHLRECIRRLPLRQCHVIRGRLARKTLQHLADELGVTKERIRQIECKAIESLAALLNGFGLQTKKPQTATRAVRRDLGLRVQRIKMRHKAKRKVGQLAQEALLRERRAELLDAG